MKDLFQLAGPLIFWLANRWYQTSDKKGEFRETYHAFLKAVDKSGAVKVANYLAAQNALEEEQQRLLKELEEGNENE